MTFWQGLALFVGAALVVTFVVAAIDYPNYTRRQERIAELERKLGLKGPEEG